MTNTFEIVLVTIILLLVIIVFAFIYFGIQRRRHLKLQAAIHYYIETYKGKWYDHLMHQVSLGLPINVKATHELLAIEAILFSYTRNVSDYQAKEQIATFATEYLQEIYRQQLRSRRWDIRMNALYRVGKFGIVALFPELHRMMKAPKTRKEFIRILMIYSHYLPDVFFEEYFKHQKHFTQYELKKLFSMMTNETRDRLITSFSLLSREAQYAAIDLLGNMRGYNSVNILRSLLNHPDSEIRVRTLKAMYELKVFIDLKQIEPFTRSAVWQERLMTAKLLENVALNKVTDIYTRLIQDDNWWVRHEAARVLSLTKEGRQTLERIGKVAEASYVAEISQHYLLKGARRNE